MVYLDGQKPSVLKGNMTAKKFIERKEGADFLKRPADIAILHTRAATSGKADDNNNNHPLSREGVVVVHNGIIWNDKELKGELKIENVEVDSIVIPAHVARSRNSKSIPESIQAACKEIGGSMACGVWDVKSPAALNVFTNGGSPLSAGYSSELKMFVFASTTEALHEATCRSLGTQFGGVFSKFAYVKFEKEGMQLTLAGKVDRYKCSDGPSRYNSSRVYHNGSYKKDEWEKSWYDSQGVISESLLTEPEKASWRKLRRVVHAIAASRGAMPTQEIVEKVMEDARNVIFSDARRPRFKWSQMVMPTQDDTMSNAFAPEDWYYAVVTDGPGKYGLAPMWNPLNKANTWNPALFNKAVCCIHSLNPMHPEMMVRTEYPAYDAETAKMVSVVAEGQRNGVHGG